MKSKKSFPLKFEVQDDQLFLFLTDNTLIIDLPTYKRNFRRIKK